VPDSDHLLMKITLSQK